MLGWLFRSRREKASPPVVAHRTVRARYDAAQTTSENSNHWANADALSANAANSPEVRRVLRNRARYEFANNCFCNGMVRTLATHTVGTGPRLQVQTDSPETNVRIEAAWESWAKEIGLASKLLTMRQTRSRDGEVFGLLVTNPRLRHPVKLDLRIIEAEMVAAPMVASLQLQLEDNYVDGIHLDERGNPTKYDVLKYHPGDAMQIGLGKHTTVGADKVVHLFREDRPGQRRGIPEITPALPLFAILRRFTLATLGSAEVAAMLSLFLKTNSPAIDPADLGDPFQLLSIERNAMTTLPDGWEPWQLKPEHPSTTYDMFQKAILREIARCLDMPFNVAAGDSSGYNYASGRLDHQTYFRAIDIDRAQLEAVCLDKLFDAWLREYLGETSGIAPSDINVPDYFHEWRWDGYEHVDPVKEAAASEIRLRTGQTSIPDECARQGLDYEAIQERQAKALGLTLVEYRERLADLMLGPAAPVVQEIDQEEETDDAA